MPLFDSFVRGDLGPAPNAESHWSFLNRSARPYFAGIRDEVEGWFSRYPSDANKHLRARLRSADDVPHDSAFFELYLHECLLRLGCTVAVEPSLGSDSRRRPDFLAHTADGSTFFLEAAVAHAETPEHRAERARLSELYDALNRLKTTDYYLDLQLHGAPTAPVRTKDIRRRLLRLLSDLDFEAVAAAFASDNSGDVPSWPFEIPGGLLIVRPLPRGPKFRGRTDVRPVGIYPSKAWFADGQSYLRRSLANKLGRYGELGAPYIVAVNALGDPPDQEDIETVLFRPAQRDAAPNSALLSPTKHTQVTAVLVIVSLLSSTFPYSTGRLWLNPWATCRCPDLIGQLPRCEFIDGAVVERDGLALRSVFGDSMDRLVELGDALRAWRSEEPESPLE